MKTSPSRSSRSSRLEQELPSEIISDLMTAIRNQFYGDVTDKQWSQEYHFLKREVVTWPAAWLNKRGVTLPPKRYKEIILGVLNEVKVHGNTGAIKFFPGYLKHCLQQHFKFHAEQYYQEGKNIRAVLERTAFAFSRAETTPTGPQPTDTLADIHRALKNGHQAKKRAKAGATKETQLGLF